MRSAAGVLVPLLVCLAGCGLVLDLDPEDPQGGADRGAKDGGGRMDASTRDAGPPRDADLSDAFVPDAEVTFTCEHDDDCQDGDPCNGLEVCNPETERCEAGTPCDPAPTCTELVCDPTRGCIYPLIDEDLDGVGAGDECGGDCADDDPYTHPGAAERFDGVDNDCDGTIDEDTGAAPCYADGDGDGWGDEEHVELRVGTCELGEVPIAGDCNDADADVHPRQGRFFADGYAAGAEPSWDYDCDGAEELRWTQPAPRCTLIRLGGCARGGWVGSVPGCGETGTWQDCNGPIGLLCSAETSTRTQECR